MDILASTRLTWLSLLYKYVSSVYRVAAFEGTPKRFVKWNTVLCFKQLLELVHL